MRAICAKEGRGRSKKAEKLRALHTVSMAPYDNEIPIGCEKRRISKVISAFSNALSWTDLLGSASYLNSGMVILYYLLPSKLNN